MSACTSFLVAMLVIFGIPRVLKERTIKGRVSWRSALTMIFSMGKRQIRRILHGTLEHDPHPKLHVINIVWNVFMTSSSFGISTYTPSKIRPSEGEIFKVYQAGETNMPLKVASGEIIIFVSFLLDKLKSLKSGHVERIENIKEIPEIENVKKELVKRINFDYVISILGKENEELADPNKELDEDYYRVRLIVESAAPGLPETMTDRTVDFVHGILMDWTRDREVLIGKQ